MKTKTEFHFLKSVRLTIPLIVATLLIASCGGRLETKDIKGTKPSSGKTHNTTATSPELDDKPGHFETKNPSTGVVTRKSCNKNEDCGTTAAECSQGFCFNKDNPCRTVTCGNLERCERGTGKYKDVGFCVPNCNPSEQCGGVCRANATDLCISNQWLPPCSDGRDHCITGSGPLCCTAGNACVGSTCVPLGTACDASQQVFCKISEYCDTTLDDSSPTAGYCIRYEDNSDLCMYRPKDIKAADVKLQWRGDAVFTTPVIADVDQDNLPDIILVGCHPVPGYLIALKGKIDDPSDIESTTRIFKTNDHVAFSDVTPAVADLDHDNSNGLEIVTSLPTKESRYPNGIVVFHGKNGDEAFRANPPAGYDFWAPSGAITIGDINADGEPEIVSMGTVYSNKGKVLFTIPFDAAKTTSTHIDSYPGNLAGDIPILADVNLDGYLDLIDGKMIFFYESTDKDSQGEVSAINMTQPTTEPGGSIKPERPYPKASYSAVADFIKNASGYPQIVNAYDDTITIMDYRGKELATAKSPIDPNSPSGAHWSYAGAPFVADIDGAPDGIPEIGVTFNAGFAVYKVSFTSSGKMNLNLLWYFKSANTTTEITGGSVFDFDGDGVAEILFNDDVNFYIISNNSTKSNDSKGQFKIDTAIYQLSNEGSLIWGSSLMPVVADVDNDGHADITIAGASFNPSEQGVKVISNPKNNWVPTRKLFNQHAYDVTNIENDGSIPTVPKKNWKQSWLNNYRQNVLEGNPFLASDLVAEFALHKGNTCSTTSTNTYDINFTLRNSGSVDVSKDSVKVEVNAIQGTKTTTLAILKNEKALPANGGSEDITVKVDLTTNVELLNNPFDIEVIVDSENAYNECHDGTQNTFRLNGVSSKNTDIALQVAVPNSSECLTAGGKVPVDVTIENSAEATLKANSFDVTLYATIGAGVEKEIGKLTIDKDVPPGESKTFTFTWNYPGDQYKLVKIRAVADESNKVPECNEGNNTASTEFLCGLYG